MDFLTALLTGWPGGTGKALAAMQAAILKAKESLPDGTEKQRLEWISNELLKTVSPYMTREGVYGAVLAFVGALDTTKWGPPNPGAAAIQ